MIGFWVFILNSKKGWQKSFFISLFTWSNKSCFFGGPAFFQPIRAFWKPFRLLWLAG